MRKIVAMMALGAAALAQPAAAQVQLPAYRSGMSAADYAAAEQSQALRDQIECQEQAAREVKAGAMTVSVPGASLLGAVIVGAAVGLASEMMEDSRTTGALKRCMTGRGYAAREPTAAEQAELKALSSADRRKWLEKTALWSPRPGSQSYALLMWDVQMNRPVTVSRDPATGEVSRSWSFSR